MCIICTFTTENRLTKHQKLTTSDIKKQPNERIGKVVKQSFLIRTFTTKTVHNEIIFQCFLAEYFIKQQRRLFGIVPLTFPLTMVFFVDIQVYLAASSGGVLLG